MKNKLGGVSVYCAVIGWLTTPDAQKRMRENVPLHLGLTYIDDKNKACRLLVCSNNNQIMDTIFEMR
mgnify:FL=1